MSDIIDINHININQNIEINPDPKNQSPNDKSNINTTQNNVTTTSAFNNQVEREVVVMDHNQNIDINDANKIQT